jgi:hypothetical protein
MMFIEKTCNVVVEMGSKNLEYSDNNIINETIVQNIQLIHNIEQAESVINGNSKEDLKVNC